MRKDKQDSEPLKLLLVGDVMLGRLVNEALRVKPPTYPWGDTRGLFQDADVRGCPDNWRVENSVYCLKQVSDRPGSGASDTRLMAP